MKRLKQFYFFLKKQLMEISVNFTENRTLELSENGSLPIWDKQLFQPESTKGPETKNDMTTSESRAKALESIYKDLESLEDSVFIVANDGKLYHKGLLGLNLTIVVETSFHELNFGYEQ